MTKQHDQGSIEGVKTFNLGFMVPEGSGVHDYRNVTMTKGRHCAEAETESFHNSQEAKRELPGNAMALETSEPTSSDTRPPTRLQLLIFPNSATNYRTSIQIYESVGVRSHSNHHSSKHKSSDPSWLLPSTFQVRSVSGRMGDSCCLRLELQHKTVPLGRWCLSLQRPSVATWMQAWCVSTLVSPVLSCVLYLAVCGIMESNVAIT